MTRNLRGYSFFFTTKDTKEHEGWPKTPEIPRCARGMTARGSNASQTRSLPEQITDGLFHDVAADFGDGAS